MKKISDSHQRTKENIETGGNNKAAETEVKPTEKRYANRQNKPASVR